MSADPINCAIAILFAIAMSIGATALKDWQAPATGKTTIAMVQVYPR